MEISQLTDGSLLELLGERLANCRLAVDMTQEQLAEQAGLGVRTIQRLESGEAATQLSGFLRVCRVLGLLENLDAFIPKSTASPMEQLKRKGKRRKRASGERAISVAEETEPWTWGDDE